MSFDLTPLFESGGTFQQIGYYSFPSITEGVSIDQLPCHLTTYIIHIKLHLRHVLYPKEHRKYGKQSQCKSIVGCNRFSLDTQIDSVKSIRQSVQGKHCVYFCRKFQKCCHFRFIQHQKLMKKEKIAQKFKVILEDLSSQSQLQMCQLIRKNGRRETKSFLVEKELKMHLKVTYTCI